MSSSCIFCRISTGEVSAYKLFEERETIAFLDAYPLARGHTVVIPKRHVTLLEDLSSDAVQSLFMSVQRLIRPIKEVLGAPATTIGINNGSESGQEIRHVHVHIIPRWITDGGGTIHSIMRTRPKVADSEMKEIAAAIGELIR